MRSKLLIFVLLFTVQFHCAAHTHNTTTTQITYAKNSPLTYLMPGSASFDITLKQFRQAYNHQYPELSLPEYHQINNHDDKIAIVRAASKINPYLYSSAAIEKSSGKIKSLQLTYLPAMIPAIEKTSSYTKSIDYMAAFICWFEQHQSISQCRLKIHHLLKKGRGSLFYQHTEGALRYVISDHGKDGLTLALEPIKLSLSE